MASKKKTKPEIAVAETQLVAITSLVPKYADRDSNPNRMEPERYAGLVAAMRDEGFLQPILVTPLPGGKWRIEDGHHRWWAAKELGLSHVSIAIKANAQSAAHATLLGIGMNRLRGELDLSTTIDVIREAQAILDGITLPEVSALTGFTLDELELLLEAPPEIDLSESASNVDSVREEIETDGAKTYTLELVFTDREQFKLVKKRLKKLGGGDMAVGVVVAIAEDD